jgi:hypothetical protein
MIKLSVTLGDNSFTFEGEEFGLSELFRLWLNAQQPGADVVKLEELTARLRGNSNALSAVVAQFNEGVI